MNFKAGDKYGLDLQTLWDMLNGNPNKENLDELRLSSGNWLRYERSDNTDYFDLFNSGGVIVCMYGELCEILEINKDYVELVEEDTQIRFKLSRREFEIAVMC